ncbi:MAG: methylenetetrahydrofolate reductase [NAD(P)H] [Thermodesulfobacteriota bacterium]|nr:methylenetetrahydrofolate reductase [NAD(P)H] [Thermodesulfobacteriota bacterium]
MHIKKILDNTDITFSFEFFPPRTKQGWENIFHTIADLSPLKPSWVSVTYGAGGSTRSNTHDLIVKIKKQTNLSVVSHLTCVGSSRDETLSILEKYHDNGIENILALKGDPPDNMAEWTPHKDGFAHASDLVSFIKKHFPDMSIGVAGFPEGHPDTPNRLKEIEHLKQKVDAGADYIMTQLFFDNHDFYDFCERCEIAGINVPIIAGIMPILTKNGMIRMASLAAGARIPAPLLRMVDRAVNDEYVAKVGVHWATEQVRDLIDHKVQGVHFYTLNNAKATLMIYEFLGVQNSLGLNHG